MHHLFRYLFICLLFPALLPAQDLTVFGVVENDIDGRGIAGARVLVKSKGEEVGRMVTDSLGRYSFDMGLRLHFSVHFEADGRVSKWVRIDTRNVDAEKSPEGFGMNVDVVLFEPEPGIDYSILKDEPIGMASYSVEEDNMVWDLKHTARIKDTLEQARSKSSTGQ
ncbi:MAG: carboxypeptidase regulatory-like domain-containing protein [Flavobacteriales bacterium]|nr:carboxypeptidase regulatory-like domain-containing protein [Flavobacteriales bacterium]